MPSKLLQQNEQDLQSAGQVPEPNLERIDHPPSSVRSKSFISSTNSFLKSLNNPKGVNRNETLPYNQLITFYVYHSILIFSFIFISVIRNFQFLYRRVNITFLTLAYNPSKTPQLIRDDVNKLNKIPKKLSCILNLREDEEENGGVDGLINDVSEIVAWTLSAGIPSLSVYEYTGILKNHLNEINYKINKNLKLYFGSENIPIYKIYIPHSNYYIINYPNYDTLSKDSRPKIDLEISLISQVDGKPTIIELTKTMSELALQKELLLKDITIQLVNEELTSLVGIEPDLILLFGPIIDLQDYPPWHIRLSEIYWEKDNNEVNYAIFLRSLQKFSTCKVNVGA